MKRRELKFRLQDFQQGFFTSKDRFPAFVAGWGTGKSLSLILKGLELSTKYPENYGLICRKTFRSLQKSTIKDFEKYTKLKVPKSTQEILIPGTESSILFTHAENPGELWETVQNMNLGWFGIEQAEELDTADVFDMLRGRLRRQDASRQGFVIANTAGHNWIWHRWKHQKWPQYDLYEANSFQNKEYLPKDTLEDWARLKKEAPRKYNQFVMNSWEDYDLEGAFYASLMSDALKAKRVGLAGLLDPTEKMYTFWDLGIRATDTTAIWFVQFVGHLIHLVDYYENYGEGIAHYSAVLNQKGYTYGAHYLPPDVKTRMQGAVIENRLDVLRRLRNEPCIPVESHKVAERIEAARGIIPRCKFEEKCRVGVEALNHYQKKRNIILSTETKPVFMPEPLHDWASNGSDAFGLIAIVYRYIPVGGQVLGYTGAYPEYFLDENEQGVSNLLEIH